jgi:hypothetical protein
MTSTNFDGRLQFQDCYEVGRQNYQDDYDDILGQKGREQNPNLEKNKKIFALAMLLYIVDPVLFHLNF